MNNTNHSAQDPLEKRQRVWQVVHQIPVGNVASYGQVAELAGLSRAARFVGTVLKSLPHNSQLPWHRVIGSQGKLAFPVGTSRYCKQKQRLQKEGVIFKGERINMKKYRWDC